MTTAARFGSTETADAQRTISFAQCRISSVKIGEIPLGAVELSREKSPARGICPGEFRFVVCANGAGLSTGSAAVGVGVFSASKIKKPEITRTASGGIR